MKMYLVEDTEDPETGPLVYTESRFVENLQSEDYDFDGKKVQIVNFKPTHKIKLPKSTEKIDRFLVKL